MDTPRLGRIRSFLHSFPPCWLWSTATVTQGLLLHMNLNPIIIIIIIIDMGFREDGHWRDWMALNARSNLPQCVNQINVVTMVPSQRSNIHMAYPAFAHCDRTPPFSDGSLDSTNSTGMNNVPGPVVVSLCTTTTDLFWPVASKREQSDAIHGNKKGIQVGRIVLPI